MKYLWLAFGKHISVQIFSWNIISNNFNTITDSVIWDHITSTAWLQICFPCPSEHSKICNEQIDLKFMVHLMLMLSEMSTFPKVEHTDWLFATTRWFDSQRNPREKEEMKISRWELDWPVSSSPPPPIFFLLKNYFHRNRYLCRTILQFKKFQRFLKIFLITLHFFHFLKTKSKSIFLRVILARSIYFCRMIGNLRSLRDLSKLSRGETKPKSPFTCIGFSGTSTIRIGAYIIVGYANYNTSWCESDLHVHLVIIERIIVSFIVGW